MNKSISIESLEGIITADEQHTAQYEWRGLNIDIKSRLGLTDVIEFARGAASFCFGEETGEYMPELRDFAIKACIVEQYTNLSLQPDSMKTYDILYSSDIIPFILEKVDKQQLEEVVDAVDARIEATLRSNIESINKQAEELQRTVYGIVDSLENLFDGIDSDIIKSLAGALASGKFDETKLMNEYLKHRSDNAKIHDSETAGKVDAEAYTTSTENPVEG